MEGLLKEEGWVPREVRSGWSGPAKGLATLITGPRRAGKSALAFQIGLSEGTFAYANFEDERLAIPGRDLNVVLEAAHSLKGKVTLLILDEVQNIEGWERFVARLVPSMKIVVTGSNARLMSGELATLLTGRHTDRELYPFSFREFCLFQGMPFRARGFVSTRERADGYRRLEEYLTRGGFPQATKFGRSFLVDLYRDILERDVLGRHRVRQRSALRELSTHLLSNSATEVTYHRLRNLFGLHGDHTIGEWVRYLEEAYLLLELRRFSFRLHEASRAPKKVYGIDPGLVGAVGSPMAEGRGRALEGLVAIELARRRSYFDRESGLYYWKDHAQREVDFVRTRGRSVVELLQVTQASDERELPPREVASLVHAARDLRCNDLRVITWDLQGERRIDGKLIRFVPVLDWLVQDPGQILP